MNPSASSLPKQAKAAPRKLPKKCWREEYIKILERFEYPPPFQSRLPNPQDTFEKVTLQALVRDLEDAGLICTHELGGISTPDRITYFGRLELERLKSERPKQRLWRRTQSAFFFALGGLFTTFLSIVEPAVASWFQGLWH